MGTVVEGVDSEDGPTGDGAEGLGLDCVWERWRFYPVEHFDDCVELYWVGVLCCVAVRYVLYAPVSGCCEESR